MKPRDESVVLRPEDGRKARVCICLNEDSILQALASHMDIVRPDLDISIIEYHLGLGKRSFNDGESTVRFGLHLAF